jgi:hypothetical protein
MSLVYPTFLLHRFELITSHAFVSSATCTLLTGCMPFSCVYTFTPRTCCIYSGIFMNTTRDARTTASVRSISIGTTTVSSACIPSLPSLPSPTPIRRTRCVSTNSSFSTDFYIVLCSLSQSTLQRFTNQPRHSGKLFPNHSCHSCFSVLLNLANPNRLWRALLRISDSQVSRSQSCIQVSIVNACVIPWHL